MAVGDVVTRVDAGVPERWDSVVGGFVGSEGPSRALEWGGRAEEMVVVGPWSWLQIATKGITTTERVHQPARRGDSVHAERVKACDEAVGDAL